MKHKHAELIHAWADGAEIEVWNPFFRRWTECSPYFPWDEQKEYRIKPEPKPDVVSYIYKIHHTWFENITLPAQYISNSIMVIYDGETGKLKSAEVIK